VIVRNSCVSPVYFDYVDEDDPFAVSGFLLLDVDPGQSLELPARGEGDAVDVRLYASRFPRGVPGTRLELEGEACSARGISLRVSS
jgi:hypothetical protein